MTRLTAWALVAALLLLLRGPAVEGAPLWRDLALLGGCAPVPLLPAGNKTASPNLSGWSATAATLTINAGKSPNCGAGAAKIVENTANTTHYVSVEDVFSVSPVQYTNSVYAKSVTGRNVELAVFDNAFASYVDAFYNPNTCTLVNGPNLGGSFTSASTATQAVKGGWCKMSVSFTAISTTGLWTYVELSTGGATNSYLGDGVSSVSVWGECLQAGATC